MTDMELGDATVEVLARHLESVLWYMTMLTDNDKLGLWLATKEGRACRERTYDLLSWCRTWTLRDAECEVEG